MQTTDARIVQNYIQRYFIHRTGVQFNECSRIYLEQELIKATSQIKSILIIKNIHIFVDQRSQFQSLEDIYSVCKIL
jgi:hypothetical protein